MFDMSTSTSMHDPIKAAAHTNSVSDGVFKMIDAEGNQLNIFMPYDKAKAMADAFNATPPASFATSA